MDDQISNDGNVDNTIDVHDLFYDQYTLTQRFNNIQLLILKNYQIWCNLSRIFSSVSWYTEWMIKLGFIEGADGILRNKSWFLLTTLIVAFINSLFIKIMINLNDFDSYHTLISPSGDIRYLYCYYGDHKWLFHIHNQVLIL